MNLPIGKDQTYWTILNAAIQLDFKKGHQKWTMSELARTTEITRSLIYYYFGKSRLDILNEAVRLVGEEFFGLSDSKIKLWAKGEIAESVLFTRREIEKSPNLGTFYLIHRNRTSEIGESIRGLE